jgi:prepilin-type N-terminal cleavage/methylation domain-containing protein
MTVSALPPADSSDRGFTLLETVLAMTVFGFAIIVAAGFLDAQMSAARRLEARADLVRAAETVLESVRGGVLPLQSAAVDLGGEFQPLSAITVDTRVEVRPQAMPDLYEVEVEAGAVVRGRTMVVSITTRIWRP